MTTTIVGIIYALFFLTGDVCCAEKPLPAPTIYLLHEALEAFDIPKNSIALESSFTCHADPIHKKILFSPDTIDERITFLAYHEAAHLINPELQNTLNKCNQTCWGIYLVTVGSIVISNSYTRLLESTCPTSISSICAEVTFFSLAHLAGSKAGSYFSQPYRIRAKHFANIQACKKLLERKKYVPILATLTELKALEYCGIEKSSYGHPPVKEEYQAMENYLKEGGFFVVSSQHACAPIFFIQLFAKDNICLAQYTKKFDPLKIKADFYIPWWKKIIE